LAGYAVELALMTLAGYAVEPALMTLAGNTVLNVAFDW
jgi:hypothetical protein